MLICIASLRFERFQYITCKILNRLAMIATMQRTISVHRWCRTFTLSPASFASVYKPCVVSLQHAFRVVLCLLSSSAPFVVSDVDNWHFLVPINASTSFKPTHSSGFALPNRFGGVHCVGNSQQLQNTQTKNILLLDKPTKWAVISRYDLQNKKKK